MDLAHRRQKAIAAGELLRRRSCAQRSGSCQRENGLRAIPKVHHTTRVKDLGFRQGQAQMLQQSGMAAARFEAGDLGGAHIKGPWTPTERAGTPPGLVMRLQQRHRQPLLGQQRRCGEAGDAATDHDHAALVQSASLNRVMLASERPWSAMHSATAEDLVAADGPLAGRQLQTVSRWVVAASIRPGA